MRAPVGFGFLPPSTSFSRISARHWVIAATSLTAAAAALAGLYPQFDRGELRPIIALTSGLLGGIVMHISLRTKSTLAAGSCALGLASLLGAVNTIVPSIILTATKEGEPRALLMYLFFGAMFGVPTGFCYGIGLGTIAAIAHRSVHTESVDAADSAKIRASLTCLVISLLSLPLGKLLDSPTWTLFGAALLAVVCAVTAAWFGHRRHSRSKWLARVRAGSEPLLRVRAVQAGDPPGLLRIGQGNSVLERVPAATDHVYRVAAMGEPLAFVDDDLSAPLRQHIAR